MRRGRQNIRFDLADHVWNMALTRQHIKYIYVIYKGNKPNTIFALKNIAGIRFFKETNENTLKTIFIQPRHHLK